MNNIERLQQAAKNAGLTLRIGTESDDHYAVVLWRSSGPTISVATHNRVLICKSHEEAMIAVEIASGDLKSAKARPGYYNA